MNYYVRFQDQFMNEVCNRFASKGAVAQFLQDTLHIGSSAAYKRINGSTTLTVQDIISLSQALQISVDQFTIPAYARVSFRSDAMRKLPQSYEQYLTNVVNILRMVKPFSNLRTTSIGNELPLFHYANFPDLYHFKLYYWKQTFWNFGSPEQVFSLKSKEVDDSIHRLTSTIGSEYYKIPSTEIWTINLFEPILKQIEYFLQLRSFENPKDALRLIQDVRALKERLQEFCKTGIKHFDGIDQAESSIEVYYNELHDGTDGLIFNTTEKTFSFIKYDGPNFILTEQEAFGQYSNQWIANIINKSSGISAKDQRVRRLFFVWVTEMIDEAEKRIQHIIDGFST